MNIASISISGEITLNLHSLNNEGGEGNQIITRQLSIIDKEGNQHTVNGISGDMFKHIHAVHLVNHAVENGLALSSYSKINDPNRISASKDLEPYFEETKKPNKTSADVVDAIVNICTVCDLHGVLITDKVGDNKSSTNTPRKSCVEYGWTVGIPNKNGTESYLHTKLVSDAGQKGSGTSSNEGQNIFHRPANHGSYAFVCNIDAYRIGFNDMSRKYAFDEDKVDGIRKARYKAVVQSLISSIINPQGAMTSTQKPHITDFKGVVTYTTSLVPAPTISAINSDYREEIKKITTTLNKLEEDSVHAKPFDSISDLIAILVDLAAATPYKIA
ncbi:DevR family CRISPR-associated autoregulator [Algibacter sp. 2305UL17-15]|uniref:DevR family CRISPR-associated autoregulator n=1 Tax=Algibacter sp. 2305UL17-15 TaxID=3231268 RepID=UPI0034596078